MKETRNYGKLLKKYTRKGQLYVLINNGTISQAEIFTLQLKRLPNVTLLGETTRGMLTYGSNEGKRVKLPGGSFEIYPTDMKGSARLLRYEDVGIQPEMYLNKEKDWIEQAVDVIRKK